MQMLNQRHSVIWFKIHCCLGTRQLLWAALVPLILTLNECCEIWLHPTLAIKVWATMTWGTLIIWRTKPRWTPRMLLAGKIERYKSRLTTCQSRHFSNFSLVAILKQLLHNNNKSNALVLFSQAGLLYATEKLFNAFEILGKGREKRKKRRRIKEPFVGTLCSVPMDKKTRSAFTWTDWLEIFLTFWGKNERYMDPERIFSWGKDSAMFSILAMWLS